MKIIRNRFISFAPICALIAILVGASFDSLKAWFFFNASNGRRQQWVFGESCNPNSRPIQVHYDERLNTPGTSSKRSQVANVHKRWNDKATLTGPVRINLFDDYTETGSLNYTVEFAGNTGLIRQILENPGSSNAGKIYVVYDQDGSAFELLGIDSPQVIGVGLPLTLDRSKPHEICSGLLILNAARIESSNSSDAIFYYTLLHELGHVLGFAHSIVGANSGRVIASENVDLPVMFPFLTSGMATTDRALNTDDRAGLYNVYGQ